jgi:hypothetical protein
MPIKISQLPDATLPLIGDELVEVDQDNHSRKAPVSAFGGGSDIVLAETPAGAINGVNTSFTTSDNFSDIAIYLNGLRLLSAHYSVTGGNSFTLDDAPLTGDGLSVDYVRS